MFLRQFILGFVFLVSSSFAFSNSEFTYSIVGDGIGIYEGIKINGCINECPSDLVVPEEIDGYSVIEIEDYTFQDRQLTSLSLPQTLQGIGWHAFRNTQLTSVTIPNSVRFIGGYAFAENQLTTLNLPNNYLLNMDDYAFYSNQLTTVNIPYISNIPANAFRQNNLATITIPSGVTSIDTGAFAENDLIIAFFNGRPPNIIGSPFINTVLNEVYYCDDNSHGLWDNIIINGIIPQPNPSCDFNGSPIEPVSYATFDIDQSGSVDALSDGLILLRYFFNLRGEALIAGVISPNANRTSAADIEAYIESHMP